MKKEELRTAVCVDLHIWLIFIQLLYTMCIKVVEQLLYCDWILQGRKNENKVYPGKICHSQNLYDVEHQY